MLQNWVASTRSYVHSIKHEVYAHEMPAFDLRCSGGMHLHDHHYICWWYVHDEQGSLHHFVVTACTCAVTITYEQPYELQGIAHFCNAAAAWSVNQETLIRQA